MSTHPHMVRFSRSLSSSGNIRRLKRQVYAAVEAFEVRSLLRRVFATIANSTGLPLVFDPPDTQATINGYGGLFTNYCLGPEHTLPELTPRTGSSS